jgi:hypothetical protein
MKFSRMFIRKLLVMKTPLNIEELVGQLLLDVLRSLLIPYSVHSRPLNLKSKPPRLELSHSNSELLTPKLALKEVLQPSSRDLDHSGEGKQLNKNNNLLILDKSHTPL